MHFSDIDPQSINYTQTDKQTQTHIYRCHHPAKTIYVLTSEAWALILRQMSIVNIVVAELKMDVCEDMRAAIMTANINPRAP